MKNTNRNILEFFQFLLHIQWLFWSKFGWNTKMLFCWFFCYISSGKILYHLEQKREKNFIWIFCDISSGKIEENLRLKFKKIFFNFLWHFQWQNWRKSGTKKQDDFFSILCDISSGKNQEYPELLREKIILWHFQWQNSPLPGAKSKKNFFEFFVTFPVAKIIRYLELMGVNFFWIFCDISSGYFLEYFWVQFANVFFWIFLWHFQWLKSRKVLMATRI